jgi:cobalt/nickel transport system permease protein
MPAARRRSEEPVIGPVESASACGLRAVDPRIRVGAVLIFAVAVVSLNGPAALAAALVVAVMAVAVAGISTSTTLRRLLAVDGLMIVVLVVLPFTVPGEDLVRIGPLAASREGLWRAIQIVLKANAIMLAVLALLGTMEAATLGHALHRLRVPPTLVHLLFFTVRYVEVLDREYRRLRLAMKARAFVPRSDRHTWRTFGYLLGMLLVRSVERAERVLQAMKCRGYDGRLHVLDRFRLGAVDAVFAAAVLVAVAALLGLENG